MIKRTFIAPEEVVCRMGRFFADGDALEVVCNAKIYTCVATFKCGCCYFAHKNYGNTCIVSFFLQDTYRKVNIIIFWFSF